MPDYVGFFLNSAPTTVELECFQLSHPSMTRVYSFCRNCTAAGITLVNEDSASVFYEYVPVSIQKGTTNSTLDQTMQISFGDLGEYLPLELDAVLNAGTAGTYPTLIYRTFRSDVLTAPMFGPIYYRINSLTPDNTGKTTFDCAARRLNLSATGEVYDYNRFPGLRGIQ